MSTTQNSRFHGSNFHNKPPRVLLLLAVGVGRTQIRADAGGGEREDVLLCSEPEEEGACSTVPFQKPIEPPKKLTVPGQFLRGDRLSRPI
jgi:hypothetical protein